MLHRRPRLVKGCVTGKPCRGERGRCRKKGGAVEDANKRETATRLCGGGLLEGGTKDATALLLEEHDLEALD